MSEMTEPKDQIIQTMVTKSDREILQREAELLDMTMSSYLRTLIRHRNQTTIYKSVQELRDGGHK